MVGWGFYLFTSFPLTAAPLKNLCMITQFFAKLKGTIKERLKRLAVKHLDVCDSFPSKETSFMIEERRRKVVPIRASYNVTEGMAMSRIPLENLERSILREISEHIYQKQLYLTEVEVHPQSIYQNPDDIRKIVSVTVDVLDPSYSTVKKGGDNV